MDNVMIMDNLKKYSMKLGKTKNELLKNGPVEDSL